MPDEKQNDLTHPPHYVDPEYSKHRRALFVSFVVEAEMERVRQGVRGQVKHTINYKECAIRAGYAEKSAGSMANYLRKQLDVQDDIRARLTAAGMSDAEIIGTAASIIRHSLADCIDISEDGHTFVANLHKAVATGAIASVKKLSYDAKGRVRIEMYDKPTAVNLLGRIRGLMRAEVKPDDYALRKMVIEDDIRAFREKRLIETGDEVLADEQADQYRAYLSTQDAYRPYLNDDPNDRTKATDPAS